MNISHVWNLIEACYNPIETACVQKYSLLPGAHPVGNDMDIAGSFDSRFTIKGVSRNCVCTEMCQLSPVSNEMDIMSGSGDHQIRTELKGRSERLCYLLLL